MLSNELKKIARDLHREPRRAKRANYVSEWSNDKIDREFDVRRIEATELRDGMINTWKAFKTRLYSLEKEMNGFIEVTDKLGGHRNSLLNGPQM